MKTFQTQYQQLKQKLSAFFRKTDITTSPDVPEFFTEVTNGPKILTLPARFLKDWLGRSIGMDSHLF